MLEILTLFMWTLLGIQMLIRFLNEEECNWFTTFLFYCICYAEVIKNTFG